MMSASWALRSSGWPWLPRTPWTNWGMWSATACEPQRRLTSPCAQQGHTGDSRPSRTRGKQHCHFKKHYLAALHQLLVGGRVLVGCRCILGSSDGLCGCGGSLLSCVLQRENTARVSYWDMGGEPPPPWPRVYKILVMCWSVKVMQDGDTFSWDLAPRASKKRKEGLKRQVIAISGWVDGLKENRNLFVRWRGGQWRRWRSLKARGSRHPPCTQHRLRLHASQTFLTYKRQLRPGLAVTLAHSACPLSTKLPLKILG